MNTHVTTRRVRTQRGFILATVLVFLVVLSLAAFFGAKLTRTNIQVVNNLQNEKEALSIAEAGVHEALYRMSLAIGDRSTVNGQTFNASLAPIVPGRSAPAGVTSYGIVAPTPTSTSQVVFTTNGVPAAGTNNAVPSLQPAALRIPYSSSAPDSAPVNLGTTANLTIGWDICANGTDPGCSAAGAIRQLPLTSPRYVVKVVSTGRSGAATRRITAQAVDCIPSQTPGNGSVVTLGQDCPGNPNHPGIYFNGGNQLTAAGIVQSNAGATSNPPSSCTDAAHTGGSGSFVHAQGINVAGGTSGNGSFTPAPSTGGLAMTDPYGNMRPPCYTGGQGSCQGSAVSNVQYDGTTQSPPNRNRPLSVSTNGAVLQPGIYYGGIDITATGVVMQPGIYIMAGGGFTVGNAATVSTASSTTTPSCSVNCGVMIFNTLDSVHQNGAAPGSLNLANGNTSPHLVGIDNPNDPFDGVVFFQDRAPTNPGPYPGTLPVAQQPDLYIQGGGVTRALDGLVYAPDARMHVQGNNVVTLGGAVIVKTLDFAGNSGLNVQNSSNPPPIGTCGGVAYEIIGWQDF